MTPVSWLCCLWWSRFLIHTATPPGQLCCTLTFWWWWTDSCLWKLALLAYQKHVKLWQSSHKRLSLLLPWLLRLTPGTESQSHTPHSLQPAAGVADPHCGECQRPEDWSLICWVTVPKLRSAPPAQWQQSPCSSCWCQLQLHHQQRVARRTSVCLASLFSLQSASHHTCTGCLLQNLHTSAFGWWQGWSKGWKEMGQSHNPASAHCILQNQEWGCHRQSLQLSCHRVVSVWCSVG